MFAATLVSLRSSAASIQAAEPLAPNDPVVAGRDAAAVLMRADAESGNGSWRAAPPVVWPAAGTINVDLSKSHGASPIQVGSGDGQVKSARVEVIDHSVSAKAGITGVAMRLQRTDGMAAEARLPIEVDYSNFRYAYGGDWGNRLGLFTAPACALTTPGDAGCGELIPLRSNNDARSGKVSGAVPASGATDQLVVLAAAVGGSSGSFAPTSLSPSATWQVGLESGDFGWSYDIDVPSMPGLEPDVDLGYSSGSVDGHVASTNNQPSWIGEGFDYQPGYIERGYKQCADDGQTGSRDLCFGSYNATIVLPGLGGELVRDDTNLNLWRAEQDDGYRVELLTGAAGNGDNDGEYWRLTAPDGTQYFFGMHRLPGWVAGNAETNSVSSVPVYGNNFGEPCYNPSFTAAWCQQAYRWQLDYVRDTHGDVMAYFYDRESNHYARGGTTPTQYTRALVLNRIEYGQRDSTVYSSQAGARVVFTAADRCLTGTACSTSNPNDWPDVPLDQACTISGCAVTTPTFWTMKRLASIKTQVYSANDYRDVASWTLTHSYPASGDNGGPALWLDSIVHTGLANGGNIALPAVGFEGAQLPNRVDTTTGDTFLKRRMLNIRNESGGVIHVTYADTECAASALPVPDSNTKRCFPAYWTRLGQTDPAIDWFHKYVVASVTETDLVGGNTTEETSYEYVGGGAWHHDDAELVPEKNKSWGQWRGFQKVRVRTGNGGDSPKTLTEHLFLRGMDDDLTAGGARKDVWVMDSQNGLVEDKGPLRGFGRESIEYSGDGGTWLSAELSEPIVIAKTASRNRPSGALEAYLTDEKTITERTKLSDGTVRTTQEITKFDSYGTPFEVNDLGDLATAADDTCTRITYARNTDAWIVDTDSRVETVSVNCDTAATRPADVISDVRTYYDTSTVWGTAPSKGDESMVDELASYSGSTPVYVVVGWSTLDDHGRAVEEFDAANHKRTIEFTPHTGGPVTGAAVTNALGHRTSAVFDPQIGQPLTVTDASDRTATLAYDALGRMVKAWQPGRATNLTPNVEYVYALNQTQVSSITTKALLGTGAQVTSYELFDGFLRDRQTQSPSPVSGSRIVTDVFHDSHGRVLKENEAYANASPPSTTLLQVQDSAVPQQTMYFYDGAGRETDELLRSFGVEKWRTTTTYGGNWVAEDPPAGATATMSVFDAAGQEVEMRQFTSGAPTGSFDATKYAYTKAGQLGSVTDPVGNVWTYTYDLRGRRTVVSDPDAGTSTFTYDDLDQMLTSTDSRSQTIAYTYDALGRSTVAYNGSTSGPKLAEWKYDCVRAPDGTCRAGAGFTAKGALTSTIRYVGANAYVKAVAGFDTAGRPAGSSVTIPATEGALAGTYTSSVTYNQAGQPATATLPAAGGLPAETLTYGYHATLGLPTSIVSDLTTYVANTSYTNVAALWVRFLGVAGKQVTQTHTWDSATGRLASVRTDRQGVSPAAVTNVSYGYDPAGNITKIADTPTGGTADVQCFQYDYLDRLSEAWAAASDVCASGPTMALLGGAAPYWHSFGYDKTGNRTSEVRHAAAGNTDRTYAYPAAGTAHPHALQSVTQTGAGGNRTDTFAYDNDGNTTQRPGQVLTWDSEGHLATVTASGATASYLYDADGERLIRRDTSGTTLYLGNTELKLTGTTVSGTRYYQDDGEVIAVRTASGLAWLINDHHETASVSIDASTLAVTRRYSTPFGGSRGTEPTSWPGERGFVGGTKDPTGLTHLGAREYDPETGRFLSVDPIIDVDDPQQMNGYAYAGNNPVTMTDPDGLALNCSKGTDCPSSKPKKTTAKKTTAKKSKAPTGHPSTRKKPTKKSKAPTGHPSTRKKPTKKSQAPTGHPSTRKKPTKKSKAPTGHPSTRKKPTKSKAPTGHPTTRLKTKKQQEEQARKYFAKAKARDAAARNDDDDDDDDHDTPGMAKGGRQNKRDTGLTQYTLEELKAMEKKAKGQEKRRIQTELKARGAKRNSQQDRSRPKATPSPTPGPTAAPPSTESDTGIDTSGAATVLGVIGTGLALIIGFIGCAGSGGAACPA